MKIPSGIKIRDTRARVEDIRRLKFKTEQDHANNEWEDGWLAGIIAALDLLAHDTPIDFD